MLVQLSETPESAECLVTRCSAREAQRRRNAAAKGLGYLHNADKSNDPKRKPNQYCKNCNLIRSESGEWRACQIFPGKGVNENGWCTAWVLKS